MFWQKVLLVCLLLIGYLIFYFATKIIAKKIVKKTKKMSISFGFQVLRAVVFAIVAIYALTQFSATRDFYQSVLTNMSLIVVVLGFAAQETIRNVLSGVMIIQSKPFNIGQRITVVDKNITGTVTDITLRHTVIKTINNAIVIVPNSVMNSAVVENTMYQGDESIANFLDIQVAYESDIEKAIKIIKDVVKSHPKYINDKDVSVLVRALGVDGYDVRATVWTHTVAENFVACSEMRILIKRAFDEHNIEIPYGHVKLVNE